jgi:MFS family permease
VLVWAVLGKEGTVAGPASHSPDAPPAAGEEPRVPYRRILLSGSWLGGFAAGFAAYWALALLTAWIPPYLENGLGYSVTTTGTLVILPWAALAVFNLGQGAVTEWLMRRGVSSRLARGVLGGAAVGISGVAMLLFPLAGGGLRLVLLTVAFSLGGIIFAIALTVNAEISPTRQRGAVLSISIGLITTAGLLAPYLTGLIVEAAGYSPAWVVAGGAVDRRRPARGDLRPPRARRASPRPACRAHGLIRAASSSALARTSRRTMRADRDG